jgi:glycyl-tRNA synthetase
MESKPTLEDVVSLAKRRGFVYPGSDIYGGLAGTYDYGPLGVALKRNIRDEWLKYFVDGWEDMYLMDSAILMNRQVWEKSGHLATFSDPMVECSNCRGRFRDDQVKNKCPSCGKEKTFGEARKFNMMFRSSAGPVEDDNSAVYLRPELAQGMFVNFKNIVDSYQPDLPFGIAQVGKAFRNEISPRDWLFRTREFDIMEFEFFVHEKDAEKYFEKWRGDMHSWFAHIGLPAEKIHEIEVPENDRAHYSRRTVDFEFDFPFGQAELAGLADRGDFDLKNHRLKYQPKDGSEAFVPHTIEPTWGLDRHVFAVLANAYSQDEQGGETRTFLKLPSHLAPVKVAVFPLLKNKPELVAKAKEVHKKLKKEVDGEVMFDDNGNIGKRYRRQDEIGTPHTITIDFQTLEDDTVTVRDRDTTQQERVGVDELTNAVG